MILPSADLDKLGQRILVAEGGEGGNSTTDWKGKEGQKLSLNLELKLIADVGFVGYESKCYSHHLSCFCVMELHYPSGSSE